MQSEFICVTNWERIDKDDFYLTDGWLIENESMTEEEVKEIREKAQNNSLYIAYVVRAIDYCIYSQMDAHQILIDDDFNEIVSCESVVIGNTTTKE